MHQKHIIQVGPDVGVRGALILDIVFELSLAFLNGITRINRADGATPNQLAGSA